MSTSRSPGPVEITVADTNYLVEKIFKKYSFVQTLAIEPHFNHKGRYDPHHELMKIEIAPVVNNKARKITLGIMVPMTYRSTLDLRKFLLRELQDLIDRYMHEIELMGDNGLPLPSGERAELNAAEARSPAKKPGPSKTEGNV